MENTQDYFVSIPRYLMVMAFEQNEITSDDVAKLEAGESVYICGYKSYLNREIIK